MSIVMNETIYIHDDAHDAFMTRPWHTTRSIGQHSYSCRSGHAIGGQARCRHGLAPALFICAVTGASLGARRPGGEAAHRGGWYEIIGASVSAGFLGTTDTHYRRLTPYPAEQNDA